MMEDASRLLVSSGLLSQPRFRRLFKSRHQETNKLEIHAQSSHVCLRSDFSNHFTVYKLQIRSKVRWGDVGEWTLEKRYSEFARFRTQLLKMTRKWEEISDARRNNCDAIKNAATFALISNALRRPISPDFPRKHMRLDTQGIINERQRGLTEFVRQLLDTYADLTVYIFNKQPANVEVHRELCSIFEELEQFLDIPATQKAVQARQVSAVLALQDIKVDAKDEQGRLLRTCCICLNDISECPEDDGAGAASMVKLPCQHHFHEDCVIDWYNTSISCPLCRDSCVSTRTASSTSSADLS